MGYRSQIVIAVAKNIYDHQVIMETVPECLLNHESEVVEGVADVGEAIFWRLDEWKWYEEYPDVKAIIEWFEMLDQEEELAVLIRPKVAAQWGNGPMKIYNDDMPPYAMLRVGEEKDDIEERGDPSYYDMDVAVEIVSPIDYS